MKNKITHIVSLCFILIAFGVSIYLYPLLPNKIAAHWNINGEVDGYMSKFIGVFLAPIIMLVLYIFYIFIPRIDPLSRNIDEFRGAFNLFWIALFTFFFYIFAITTAWNVGMRFDFAYVMAPAMGLLFYFIGSLLRASKRNFFIGIRTPWTLSSDVVWHKTHRVGGRLFEFTGIFTIAASFFGGKVAMLTMLISIAISTIISIVYSYVLYKNLAKDNG
ncbi:MAG: SdpI family protein [Candidatus Paceibacteria bacterium]